MRVVRGCVGLAAGDGPACDAFEGERACVEKFSSGYNTEYNPLGS